MALDTLVDGTQLDADLTTVANAIRTKGGTSASLSFPSGFVSAINDITTEPVSVEMKDVNFFDYEGTVLYSYTAAEFANLSELPSNPIHTGLTAQGWNWTLSDAKSFVASYGKLNIGQMYITSDGKTRLYIHIMEPLSKTVPLYFSQTVANGVTIDWGDQSNTETVNGTGEVNTSHTYSNTGYYVIALSPTQGCSMGLGHSSNIRSIMGSNGRYTSLLQGVQIGGGISNISEGAFQSCNISFITIPNNILSIKDYAFSGSSNLRAINLPINMWIVTEAAFEECAGLKTITIPGHNKINDFKSDAFYGSGINQIILPESLFAIWDGAFRNCYFLSTILITEGITKIYGNAFRNCRSLSSITIPSTVNEIQRYAFYNCTSLTEIHLKPSEPPTLELNAFSGPSFGLFTIYVPSASLNAYKTAENWSDWASCIVGE